jgi:25S rRNA (adenine2142-N1)-methyltransferase
MATRKKHIKKKPLSHGRPPTIKRTVSVSSKATRTLIRTHHTLEKQRVSALANGDDATAASISRKIEAQGGINTYQCASLLGQKNERGGDSSKILIGWLEGVNFLPEGNSIPRENTNTPLRLLEVGALSTNNACSRSGLFEVERIDLNSQAEGITEQDFMERPLPKDFSEKFDIISLSLVLNYVPNPVGRGEMLKRTVQFLRHHPPHGDPSLSRYFPSLFLVLPAPCITNSRYLDEHRLDAIMRGLGYIRVVQKLSNKLAYYLWRATDFAVGARTEDFKKVEVRSGGRRNNFAIVLKGECQGNKVVLEDEEGPD